MKKRVFIIHGWEGTPDSNWFGWMKTELEKNDFEATVPQMPNADFPKQKEWLTHMQKVIGGVDESTFLVGHSLGVIAILRFLENIQENQKVGGAILVSGFSETLGTIPEIENFFADSVDYEKIKTHCKNFIVINSDNDPYVPLDKGGILRDTLNAKFIVLNGAGHINMGTGDFKLPVAVEELLRISK